MHTTIITKHVIQERFFCVEKEIANRKKKGLPATQLRKNQGCTRQYHEMHQNQDSN